MSILQSVEELKLIRLKYENKMKLMKHLLDPWTSTTATTTTATTTATGNHATTTPTATSTVGAATSTITGTAGTITGTAGTIAGLCPDVRRIDELLVAAQKLRIKEQSLPPSSSSEKPSAADNGKALVKKQTKSQNFRKSSVAMENRPVAMETKPVAIATNRVQSDVSDNELFILRDGGKCLKLPHNYRHLKKQLKSLELLVTSSNDEPSNDVFVDTNEQQNIRYIELLMLRNELELIKEEYLSLSQDNHHPSTMQVIGKLQFLDESITKLLSCSKSTTLPPFELSHKARLVYCCCYCCCCCYLTEYKVQ
jgi:hypothetical protein